MNTGLSLKTNIKPDSGGAARPAKIHIARTASGTFGIHGTNEVAATFILEGATYLKQPMTWQALQTNNLPAGPFSLPIAHEGQKAAFFRVRRAGD
jgi:hypothetical protein